MMLLKANLRLMHQAAKEKDAMARQKAGLTVSPLPAELVDLARAVVARFHEAELEAFDDLLADFEDDPEQTVRGVQLGAPVGMGIELAAMTPWVLTAAGMVGGVLAEKVTGDAYAAAQRWLKRALAQRKGAQVEDEEPAGEGAGQIVVLISLRLSESGVPEAVGKQIGEQVVEELKSCLGSAEGDAK